MVLTLSFGFGMADAIRLPSTIAIPEQDVTIPSVLFPLLGMTRAGSTASKAYSVGSPLFYVCFQFFSDFARENLNLCELSI